MCALRSLMVFPIIPIVSTSFFTGGGAIAMISPFCGRETETHEDYTESSQNEASSTLFIRTNNEEGENIIDDNEDSQSKQQTEIFQAQTNTEGTTTLENLHTEDILLGMDDALSLNLYELAKLRRWNTIVQRSKMKPIYHSRKSFCDPIISFMKEKHKSSQTHEAIQNALYESCLNDPPVEVISALLQMSSQPKNLLKYQNNATKSTPLHIACYAGANLHVIELLINSYPEAVLKRNGIGWTPLHLLCWGTDDDEIAQRRKDTGREYNIAMMLLLQHPQQEKSQNEQDNERCHPRDIIPQRKAAHAIQMQDKIGWTPLHLACWGGASFDVINLLLKSQKGSASMRTKDGWTPLHLACRYTASVEIVNALLDAAPQSASVKAKGGWCPLHLACWWKSSSQVIRTILKAYPSAAKVETWEDYKPIEILWQRHLETCTQNKNFHGFLSTHNVDNEASAIVDNTALFSMDSNMELCENISLLLHAARFREVSTFTMKENGPMQLIYAIAAIASNAKCPRQIRLFILRNLSRIHAGEVMAPNGGDGSTLLSIAINIGATWSYGVEIIFRMFPEAIYIRDKRTNLYPFMQAATISEQNTPIDTVYNLLRAAPEMLQNKL